MQDAETQRELLKETRTAKKALELAINIEMGNQSQLKISGTEVYTVSNQIANTSIKTSKTHGIDLYRQRITENLQFAQTADTLGWPVIVRSSQHGEKTAKLSKVEDPNETETTRQ